MIFDRFKVSADNFWVTSDLHFFHANVVRFDKAPFQNIQERDAKIIGDWNAHVRPDDFVFILGDVSLGKLDQTISVLKRLNGKLILILGNHDKVIQKNKALQDCFFMIERYLEVEVTENGEKQLICMFHYPIWEWNQVHRGAFHLYGHTHNNDDHPLRNDYKCLNVGIMNHDYKLLDFRAIKGYLNKRRNKEHH